MPALAGDIMEVVFQGRLHGQQIRNVRHYRIANIAGPSQAPEVDAATALAGAMETFWNILVPLVSNEFSMLGILVQRIFPLPRTVGVIRVPANGTGQAAGNSLPTAVAVVTRLTTAFAGRKYRGRNYWCGIPATAETDSELTAGAIIAWEGVQDALTLPLQPAAINGRTYTFQPVILNRPTMTTTDIVGGTVDSVLRTQRRRQVGKGA